MTAEAEVEKLWGVLFGKAGGAMSDAQWFAYLCAPATFVYNCYANPLCGFDCKLFADVRSAVEFPRETRP